MALTCVLLPGLHGTSSLFHEFCACAPAGAILRALDYPLDKPMGYSQLLPWVQEAIADLDNVVLIAESFSGPVALRLAALNPSRVRAVVLVGSFIGPAVPRVLCWLGAPLALVPIPLAGPAIRYFISGFSAPGRLVRAVRQEVWRNRGWVIARRILAISVLDAREDLKRCPTPILCLAGQRDRLVGPRALRRILRVRPDIAHRTLNTPHLIVQSRPHECWKHVKEFMLTLGAPFPGASNPRATP